MTLKLSVKLANLVATKSLPSNLLLSNCSQGSKGPVSFPSAAFRNSLTSVWFATLWTSPPVWCEKRRFSWGNPLNLVGNGILVVNPGAFGKKKYHLLPPISAAAGFFVSRENLGVFYTYWWETIHFWPQRPPILVRLPTRMYIGSIGFTPSSSHHQITTLLVGDPYTAHTPLLSHGGAWTQYKYLEKQENTTKQTKLLTFHSLFEIEKNSVLENSDLFTTSHGCFRK